MSDAKCLSSSLDIDSEHLQEGGREEVRKEEGCVYLRTAKNGGSTLSLPQIVPQEGQLWWLSRRQPSRVWLVHAPPPVWQRAGRELEWELDRSGMEYSHATACGMGMRYVLQTWLDSDRLPAQRGPLPSLASFLPGERRKENGAGEAEWRGRKRGWGILHIS